MQPLRCFQLCVLPWQRVCYPTVALWPLIHNSVTGLFQDRLLTDWEEQLVIFLLSQRSNHVVPCFLPSQLLKCLPLPQILNPWKSCFFSQSMSCCHALLFSFSPFISVDVARKCSALSPIMEEKSHKD